MDNFFFILLVFCVFAYVVYLDLLTEENLIKVQKLSNDMQEANGGVVDNKWIIYFAQKRKHFVAGALSLSSSFVVGVAKVIFNLSSLKL